MNITIPANVSISEPQIPIEYGTISSELHNLEHPTLPYSSKIDAITRNDPPVAPLRQFIAMRREIADLLNVNEKIEKRVLEVFTAIANPSEEITVKRDELIKRAKTVGTAIQSEIVSKTIAFVSEIFNIILNEREARLLYTQASLLLATSFCIPTIALHCIDIETDKLELQDSHGFTALHLSSYKVPPEYGNVALKLISKGANISATTHNRGTPLYFACMGHQLSVIEKLLELEVPVFCPLLNGRTPLIALFLSAKSISEECPLKVIDLLLERHVSIDAMDSTGRTALFWASDDTFKFKRSILQLIERRADVNVTITEGTTLWAQVNDNPVVDYEIVLAMLNHGARNDLNNPTAINKMIIARNNALQMHDTAKVALIDACMDRLLEKGVIKPSFKFSDDVCEYLFHKTISGEPKQTWIAASSFFCIADTKIKERLAIEYTYKKITDCFIKAWPQHSKEIITLRYRIFPKTLRGILPHSTNRNFRSFLFTLAAANYVFVREAPPTEFSLSEYLYIAQVLLDEGIDVNYLQEDPDLKSEKINTSPHFK